MIWLLAAIVSLGILHWGGKRYFALIARHTRDSLPVWDRAVINSTRMIRDDIFPDQIKDLIYTLVMDAGRGRLAAALLKSLAVGKMDRNGSDGGQRLATEIARLPSLQHSQLSHVLADVILFDSYQLPVRGVILRRALWWIYAGSWKQEMMIAPDQLMDVAVAIEQVAKTDVEHAESWASLVK